MSNDLPWEEATDAVATAPAPRATVPTAQQARTLRDLEHMIGVDPIDVLLADRRAVVEELAPLRAKYGTFGTFDARRKAFRSMVANEIAARITETGGKRPAEAELERLAAGDPRVLGFLDNAEAEMARYYLLENEAQNLTDLLRRGDALVKFATFEPR